MRRKYKTKLRIRNKGKEGRVAKKEYSLTSLPLLSLFPVFLKVQMPGCPPLPGDDV